jgi:hypothetical protein
MRTLIFSNLKAHLLGALMLLLLMAPMAVYKAYQKQTARQCEAAASNTGKSAMASQSVNPLQLFAK